MRDRETTNASSRFLELFLGRRISLSGDDRKAIASVPVTREVVAPFEKIVEEGATANESCLLIRGMAMRAHTTRQGERVVSAISVAGDFVDLPALMLKTLDHDIVSIGRTVVERFPHDALRPILQARPHLMECLWHETLTEAKHHRIWIVAGASLVASQRIAHLMCELEMRLARIGLAEAGRFTVPLDQRMVADMLGYSAVHVNRAVQELRGSGLLEWNGRNIVLSDPDAIRAFAEFDPSYLEP